MILGLQLQWKSTRAHTAWMVVPSLNLACHLVLHTIGSRSGIERLQKHSWYFGMTTELPLQQIPLCSRTQEHKSAWKVVLFIFRQQHHVQPWLMCLRQGDVPILFSLLQMRNFEVELDPQGDKIACPSFCLSSSQTE